MIDNEHNLDPYQDLLAGLERLAGSLDQQTSPLAAGQTARNCRLAAVRQSVSFWSRSRVALAAAAVLVVVGLGAWMTWPGQGSHVKTITWHPSTIAPAASRPAESEAISFAVPSVSLPSLSGDNSLTVPSANQTPVQMPAMPKSESVELKFEIPSITFPTLTERISDEM